MNVETKYSLDFCFFQYMYIICKETDFFAERKRKSLSELFEKFFLEGKNFSFGERKDL
jgi:hypothetical protein